MSEQWGCRSHLGDEWCSGRADAEQWVDVRPGILINRIVSEPVMHPPAAGFCRELFTTANGVKATCERAIGHQTMHRAFGFAPHDPEKDGHA